MFGSVTLYPSSDHQHVFLLFTSVYCFVDVLHYIHLQDRQYVYYIFVIIIKIIKYKKNNPWFTMGKNIKVMPQPNCPLSLGKGGIPYS